MSGTQAEQSKFTPLLDDIRKHLQACLLGGCDYPPVPFDGSQPTPANFGWIKERILTDFPQLRSRWEATARPMSGTARPWGYEYSEVNKAYEIAPFGHDGTLDWTQEVAITADDNEANAKLICAAVNHLDAAVAALEACRDYITGWDGVRPDLPLHPADKRGQEAQEALALVEAALAALKERR